MPHLREGGSRGRTIRRAYAYADARSANPFESVLRAIVIESGALDVVPQHPVLLEDLMVQVDLPRWTV